MKVAKLDFLGNPNIGLYAHTTNSYCLVGNDVRDEEKKKIHKVLGVPVHSISIAGTALVGVLLAGNDEMLLVPEIVFDSEIKLLEKLKIPFTVIPSSLTAFGNNMLIGKEVCLVNPEYSVTEKKKIREALSLKVVPGTLQDTGSVGSLAFTNGKGIVVCHEISHMEGKELEKHFKLPINHTSINQENPYLHSGIIANKNGCCIGAHTSGVEVNEILEGLGFL